MMRDVEARVMIRYVGTLCSEFSLCPIFIT